MKKMSAKLLSLILSVVLAVSMLPGFAINASAEGANNLLAQYFSTDNIWYDTVSKSGNALQWVEGDYPVYQNGFTTFGSTYVRIANQNLFADVDQSTGLTVSFKYYSTESANYRHILSLGKRMEPGSADHLYISANPSHIGGGTAPVIGYVDSSGNEHINAYPSGAPAFEANKMYDVDIVFSATTITYYINGVEYRMVGDSDSATYLATFLNEASTFANNYIGYSRWGDPKFNGGIKNMRIYGKALSETEIIEEKYGVTASDLKNTFDGASINRSNISFNTVPFHTGAEVTTGYSNVVYAPSWTTSWSGDGVGDNYIEVGRTSFKVAVPRNIVLAYDGVNDVAAPIVLETVANNTNDSSFRIHYVCGYSTKFALAQNWQGYWRAWNAFDVNNLEAEEDFANNTTDEHPSDDSQRDSTSRFWWNSLGYTGTGNTTDYYDVDKNLSYYAKTSYNQNGTRNYKYGDIYSICNNYVINFKPVYDILPSVYTNYTTNIQNKEWMYTDESLEQMMLALYLLGRSNPNTWNYSTNAEDAVTDCANTIKLATRLYSEASLVKKQFTVKFVKANGDETTKTITAGNPLGTLPANSDTVHIDGTTTHRVYSWGATTETVVQSDTTYNEQSSAVNCTFNASYVWPTATSNGYTDYTCSVCNYTDLSQRTYDALNWTAYDNAVTAYNNTVGGEHYAQLYTAASRSAYETRVQNAKIDRTDNSVPQATIDAAKNEINAAKNDLVAATCTIKFVKANGDEITRTVTAGEELGQLPANSSASHIEGTTTHNVYSWGVTAGTVVYESATYNEVATPDNCFFRSSHVAATATTNGYTDYTCSTCNFTDRSQRVYDQTDWSAYDAAVADYNATIGDADYTSAYTAASRAAYEARVQAAQIAKADTVPQTMIDDAAAEIIAAKSELSAQPFTVSFDIYVDGVKQYSAETDYAANSTANLEVPAQYRQGAEVYKWTHTDDNNVTETHNTKAYSMTYITCANAAYAAYLTTGAEAVPAASSKVSVLGMGDALTDVGFVENGTYEVTIDRSYGLEIGEKTFKAKSYAFYTLTGYDVDGELVGIGDYKTVTINKDIEVRAIYEPVSLATINFVGCYETKNQGASSIQAPFDQKLEVTADDATSSTAWYTTDSNNKKTLIGYGKSITTRVTDNATISKENANAPAPSVALEYFAYGSHKANTTTVIGSYYLPADCEFVEAGFVLKTDRTTTGYETQNNYTGTTTLSANQLTTANATGVFKATGIADTNQFMFSISRTADTHFIMGARTYLKYRQGGELKTAYSDMRLIAYAG